MTILDVARNVCLVIGLGRPETLLTNTDRAYIELGHYANDSAYQISQINDWQSIMATGEIIGDGSSESFPMPDNFDRMLSTANMWSNKWALSITHVPDTDSWLGMQQLGYSSASPRWTIIGNRLYVTPIMVTGHNIKFIYIKKDVVMTKEGTTSDRFVSDTDKFILPEKLLEYHMIWQFREKKGLPFEDNRQDYYDELTRQLIKDKGSRKVVRASDCYDAPIPRNQITYPFEVNINASKG